MATISDALSQAIQGVKGVVGNDSASLMSRVSQISNGPGAAVAGGVSAIRNAGAQLMQGNLSGAAQGLINSPLNIINGVENSIGGVSGPIGSLINGTVSSALQSLGIQSGTNLTGPGFSASGNGGVSEGNSLGGALARNDPLMNFNWYCVLPQLTGTVYGSVGLPWFYVEEATIPFRVYQQRSVYRAGRTKQYASRYSVENMHLGLYLDSSSQTWNYLKAWNAAIVQPFARAQADVQGGVFNTASVYKKDIYIFLLDATKTVVIQILMSECWPQSMETFNLGSNSSERLLARVTFNVGDVFMDMNPAQSNTFAQGIIPDFSTVGTSIPLSDTTPVATARPVAPQDIQAGVPIPPLPGVAQE